MQAGGILFEVPHQALLVLHPFEIACGDAAGVGQNVRKHGDAASRENFIGVGSGGAVRGFGDDAGLDRFGVSQGDYIFEGRGDQDVALHGEQFVVGGARGAGHADDGAGSFLVSNGLDGIDAAGIGDAAAGVAKRDNFCFFIGEEPSDGRARVAEALDGDGRSAQGNFFQLAGLLHDGHQAARRGFFPAGRSADGQRLAGDHCLRSMADHHSVGIHDPGHGLRIGINVGSGNVEVGTDDRQNFAGIAAGHALELGFGHTLGIADDAALGAPKGHVDRGGFPGHPCGERFDFVKCDVRMVADAALAGSARHVVLHAVAGENFYLTVIHLCRDGNFQDALGSAQDLPQSGIELQEFRGHIELNLRDAKWVEVFARSDTRHHRGSADLSQWGSGLYNRGHRGRDPFVNAFSV